jgi:ubiquinone/menaquinone biosynthesis C-methylase UbiE
MPSFWARLQNPSGQPGPNYWEYFAQRIALLAVIPHGATLLDIGTHDGNVLYKAMQKVAAQAYGIGIDIHAYGFPAGMAEARQRGWEDKVAFVQMDANRLGFQSESFHTVLANFVGWDDCFDFERLEFKSVDRLTPEIWRVLKPGGQVGIGSWVDQGDIEWLVKEFKKYLPEYAKDIACYSEENPAGYQIILKHSGFENIRVVVETTDFVSSDAEVWWRQMNITADELFLNVPDPSTLENFKKQVFTDLGAFECAEGIRFSKTVLYAFATKPG